MNQENKKQISISVAPMLDWTNQHCRFFLRVISPNTLLYTEMVTTGALVYGDRDRYLEYNKEEHPIALQLGGSDPHALAKCSKMAEDKGYDEINLNCGCPSDRVQKGQFGAVLMTNPDLVAQCIEAMKGATALPLTIKCRIGVDEQDSFEFLDDFITTTKQAGTSHYIIHARKCWLKGLSPKENRSVPPINYDRAITIKEKHKDITIALNGEIKTLPQIKEHLKTFDSVMIGREAYQNPFLLNEIEQDIFGNSNLLTREQIAHAMIPYIEEQCKKGARINTVTRHMMGLFKGQKGGKKWRQILSTLPHQDNVTPRDVIEEGLSHTD